MLPSLRSRRRPACSRARAVALAATVSVGAGMLSALLAAPAGAAPPGPHDPYGHLSRPTATATGIQVTGWAVDPDARTANAKVIGLVDGLTRATALTSVTSRTVTRREQSGPTPGFVLAVPVPAGAHTVCVAVANVGTGMNTVLGCVATPLGTTLTSTQVAAHSPQGSVTSATANATSIHVSGFMTDPDYRNRRQQVVLYVDNRSVATVLTQRTTGAPAGSGRYAGFSITVPVTSATHIACVWAVNVGFGSNAFYGCTALDTRAGTPMPVGTPSTAILPKVLAEAKKHLGGRYVWAAEGPKVFDCSGLMQYSYGKYGFVTPRVSQDQIKAARLIPASHALPGDLVFFHDTEGDVYHVAMYVSPGLTVAAIDVAEGINYQRIYDPTTVSYGSFTHL